MSRFAYPISLASGVLPEFGPVETINAAIAGKFDAVGLWVDPEKWSGRTTREVKRRLVDANMPVLDVEVIWIKPGPLDPDHLRIIDIGADLNAKNALVVSSDPNHDATAEKFSQLCTYGRERDMRIALEFGMFTEVKTLQAALDIIAIANDEAAALLVDPIHLSRSGGHPYDLVNVPDSLFSYAQICDAVPVGPNPDDFDAIIEEAVDGRLQMGQGALPLPELLNVLPERLPLSVELRSKALRDYFTDAEERAKAVANHTRCFLRELST